MSYDNSVTSEPEIWLNQYLLIDIDPVGTAKATAKTRRFPG